MMKPFVYLITIFTLFFSCFPALPAHAQTVDQPEQNSGAVVCAPGVYLSAPEDCLPLGPSEYLTAMARLGMTLPLQPISASTPDYSLNNLPYHYYKVNPTGTSFYPSLDAAVDKQGASNSLAPGSTLYVTYLEVVDTGKGIYFRLPSGEWMPGDGSRVGVGPIFQGLQFSSPPKNAFGWAWDNTDIRSEPSYASTDLIIGTLHQYDKVQVYSVQNVEGTEWNLIGPDQWVEARTVAVVFPNTTPPEGVTTGRWIDVDLAEQTLAVYENQNLVFATFVATGREMFWTRPGLFQIYKKKELENMRGFNGDPANFYYLENVPWTMYFDKARALHGAYWNPKLGFPQSHGCVNLSIGDSAWLFKWANEGDWVYVHDPSGLTPTDPAKYGEGGA